MIYGYVRVSTDKQSTENQRFEIENYSKAKGFRIERWVDETISGTTNVSDRQLGRLLKQIRKGDTLVTTELSRLGRNLNAGHEFPSPVHGTGHHRPYSQRTL